MKANKAPERIYIKDFGDKLSFGYYTKQFDGFDIEYTRTDAFIEKACEWLEPVFKNYAGYYCGSDLLEDFKKAMKL